MAVRPSILLVTDLSYDASGRRYGDEDVWLASRLRTAVDLALCHPLDAAGLMGRFDAVMVRNSGPVLHYRTEYDAFRDKAIREGVPVYNPLNGRGDMAGKGYLVDLTRRGEPVIPTVASLDDLDRLPASDRYVAKPVGGADSIGLEVVDRDQLPTRTGDGILIQPWIELRDEVSFYFVDDAFQYALYAPDPQRRWALETYEPSPDDLAFARRFIDFNTLEHGIQRVDAGRTRGGDLLLIELEDHNPFLSLDLLTEQVREAFIAATIDSLLRFVRGRGRCTTAAGGAPDRTRARRGPDR